MINSISGQYEEGQSSPSTSREADIGSHEMTPPKIGKRMRSSYGTYLADPLDSIDDDTFMAEGPRECKRRRIDLLFPCESAFDEAACEHEATMDVESDEESA